MSNVDQSMGPIKGYFPTPDTAYFFQSDIQHWGQKLVDIRHIFQQDTWNPYSKVDIRHCQKFKLDTWPSYPPLWAQSILNVLLIPMLINWSVLSAISDQCHDLYLIGFLIGIVIDGGSPEIRNISIKWKNKTRDLDFLHMIFPTFAVKDNAPSLISITTFNKRFVTDTIIIKRSIDYIYNAGPQLLYE